MSISDSFFEIANKLSPYSDDTPPQATALINAANIFGKSWSGSWLGYHSRVYYRDFEVPPQGDYFTKEWGLLDTIDGSMGDWVEYNFDDGVLCTAPAK